MLTNAITALMETPPDDAVTERSSDQLTEFVKGVGS
ncbi:unnamed protein product, partial [Allacma fusca]